MISLVNYRVSHISTGDNHCLVGGKERDKTARSFDEKDLPNCIIGWGDNSLSQLTNDLPTKTEPKVIPFFMGTYLANLSCGANHSIILDKTGRVFGFGSNKHNQLSEKSQKPIIHQPIKIFLGKENIIKSVHASQESTILFSGF